MRPSANVAAAICALLALANCSRAIEPQAARAPTNPSAEATRVVSELEQRCLAEAIYFEAHPSAASQSAVAHVILNRARDPRFPPSVCGVVGDGCQFSYRCAGGSLALVDARKRAAALRTATSVLRGTPDITGGALFFHSARASAGWFASRKRVGEIGGNVFYR